MCFFVKNNINIRLHQLINHQRLSNDRDSDD